MASNLKTLSLIGGTLALTLALSGCTGGFTVEEGSASGSSSSSSKDTSQKGEPDVKSDDKAAVLEGLAAFGTAIIDSAPDSEKTMQYMESLDPEVDKFPDITEVSKTAPYLNHIYFDDIEDEKAKTQTLLVFIFMGLSFQHGAEPGDAKRMFTLKNENLVTFDETDPKKATVKIDDQLSAMEFPMIQVDGKWLVDGKAFNKLMDNDPKEPVEPPTAENNADASSAE